VKPSSNKHRVGVVWCMGANPNGIHPGQKKSRMRRQGKAPVAWPRRVRRYRGRGKRTRGQEIRGFRSEPTRASHPISSVSHPPPHSSLRLGGSSPLCFVFLLLCCCRGGLNPLVFGQLLLLHSRLKVDSCLGRRGRVAMAPKAGRGRGRGGKGDKRKKEGKGRYIYTHIWLR
jgi:hypothetical protein